MLEFTTPTMSSGAHKKKKELSLGNLLTHFHRFVDSIFKIIVPKVNMGGAQRLGAFNKLRNGHQIKVGGEVPEEGRRDTNERTIWELSLAPFNCLQYR